MRPILVALLVPLFGVTASAQTSFPMITHCTPTAVQRGTSTEITVEGQMNFTGAYKVLLEGSGVTAEIVQPKDEKPAKPADPKAPLPTTRTVKLKITVSPQAPLGVREFRIATSLGVSSLGQLVVVSDPVVTETAGINTPAKAQIVSVPCVVCGRTEIAENVDYYRIKAKAGQVLTFEVYCARIQDKIHDLQKHADPLIRLFDAEGHELAASDDDYFADPLLTYRVQKDGEYLVEIRDAKYDGDPRWSYALAITDRPYAALMFPMAVNPGQSASVEPVGSAKLVAPKVTFTAPTRLGVQTMSLPLGAGSTNPAPIVVTPLPLVTEQEPNETIKQATRITLPGGANGRIQVRRDLDYYVIKGEKGKAVRLEVFARRFGTPLQSRIDASIDVLNASGAPIASNDDANGKDPALTFTPSAEGDFYVRVRDLNNKGGDGFVYYLEADLARPDFTIKCDPSKAMIGPGSRTAWYVQVTRLNGLTGPVKVQVKGLPKGVTVNPLTIPESMTQGCLVVSAAADAKMDASIVEVIGTIDTKDAAGKPLTLTRTSTPVEEIYFPGGGRGRFDADMQAVAITNTSDLLEVKVSTNKIVLKPGEEVKIDVTVKRRADYDKTVTLDVILRHLGSIFGNPLPPGVTMVDGKSKTLLGTGNTGTIVLKAAADAAECTDVPLSVQGYVPINFVVKIGYSSEPILITVKK